MKDLRQALYDRYVSSFKGDQTEFNTKSYWAWCNHKIRSWLVDLPRDSAVLELGCGPGYLLGYITNLGFSNVEGIDISAEQVILAKKSGHRAAVVDVFDHLATKPAEYNLIVGFDILEHFNKEELGKLVGAIYRSLKPGGRFIAQTPNGEGLFPNQIIYGDLTHSTILTPGSFRQLFQLYGYKEFLFRETGPTTKNLVGVIRLAIWKFIRIVANFVRRVEAGKKQAIWTENMLCRCQRPADIEG